MATREQIIEMLETVTDPELGLDIWTMGLVYEIDIKSDTHLQLLITYTSPMCPAGPIIQQEITDSMRQIGFSAVEIEVTFDPPWKPTDKLRAALGI